MHEAPIRSNWNADFTLLIAQNDSTPASNEYMKIKNQLPGLAPKWKSFCITWLAIYPLALLIPPTVASMTSEIGLELLHWQSTVLSSGLMVLMMVYVFMPLYTKLFFRWLHQ